MKKTAPKTASERVAKSRARTISDGGMRVDVILTDPAAIASLSALVDAHGSKRAAVEHALRSASIRFPTVRRGD